MALLEDMLKGNLLTAAAMGTTALVLPRVLPHVSPRLRTVVKGGISLFLESRSEAEGGIIDRLADNALKNVLDSLSPGSTQDRGHATRQAIESFKRTARRRSRRHARNGDDGSAHYRRQVAALQRALAREQARQTGEHAATLARLSAELGAA